MSATLLGFYDSFKKKALKGNAVIPVLFLNTVLSSLIFIPFIIVSYNSDALDGTIFHVGSGGWEMHKFIVLKSLIALSSWILGYKASAFVHSGTYQCHSTSDDACRCYARVWRAT